MFPRSETLIDPMVTFAIFIFALIVGVIVTILVVGWIRQIAQNSALLVQQSNETNRLLNAIYRDQQSNRRS